jgi:hypothetical protein
MDAASVALLLIGAFFLIPSWRDWDWFFSGWKMQFITEIFGREKIRIFYMILGGALILGAFVTAVS